MIRGSIGEDAQAQTCAAEGNCSVLQGKGVCSWLVVSYFSYFEVFSIHEKGVLGGMEGLTYVLNGCEDVLCLSAVETEGCKSVMEQGERGYTTEQALGANGESFAVGADTVCVVFLHGVVVDCLYLTVIFDGGDDVTDCCRIDLLKQWDYLQSDLVSGKLIA